MNNCSISLQILPLSQSENKERIEIIDKVIAYITSNHNNVVISPFETVIEGDFDELMATLKQCIIIAGENCDNIFANVKINYGSILTIDEKLSKFTS